VVRAAPRFDGHYQPHLPGELGFYDLRLPDTRAEQAALAANNGIDAFCYYHYWFEGTRLLERPFAEVLASGQPDFPFCLCWANETWTRAWDGGENQILVRQTYSAIDHERHITWLLTAFKDRRYLKIDNKPVFLIYRPQDIPDSSAVLSNWRERAKSAGFDGLYFIGAKTGFGNSPADGAQRTAFDAVLDFQPNRDDFPTDSNWRLFLMEALRKYLPNAFYQKLKLNVSALKRVDYNRLVEVKLGQYQQYRSITEGLPMVPCVFPSWDNSARRKSPTIIQNLDPRRYAEWLKHAIEFSDARKGEPGLVFVNAWNEWAEGCYLEPDFANGRDWLDATRLAVIKK